MSRILDTHDDPRSGELVAVLESDTEPVVSVEQELGVTMPPSCARCGAPPTREAKAQGEGNVHGFTHASKRRVVLQVPYCDACYGRDVKAGRRVATRVFVVALLAVLLGAWLATRLEGWWQALPAILAVLGIGAVLAAAGVFARPLRDGGAVRIVVDGTTGPIRLQFKSRAYGEAFVAANGPAARRSEEA